MAHQRSNRLNFEIFGNPAASNRIKTLATDPFYLFSSDHPLAMMLPEALNTTEYGGKVGIAIKDMNFLVLAGLALDPEVANAGVHFFIDPSRLSRLFADMDAQGAQFDPIQGDATIAMPRAHSILSDFIARMPIGDRIIEADDVFYDGPADNAGTGTCFDWITPKLFITGEGHERHELTRPPITSDTRRAEGRPVGRQLDIPWPKDWALTRRRPSPHAEAARDKRHAFACLAPHDQSVVSVIIP